MRFAIASLLLLALLLPGRAAQDPAPPSRTADQSVYIIPIREPIMPSLVYLVRRGVKAAMEADADLLILDMHTDGGRVDTTLEVIEILHEFPNATVTYVNDRAFSAGAFISVATERIFMAPTAVIGAAAPVMMTPGGGVQESSGTVEAKTISAVQALVRSRAAQHGHNTAVIEAMIDKDKRLELDGEIISEEGELLTLTATEAVREYGDPPEPLLAEAILPSLDALIEHLGYSHASQVYVTPTGAEQVASWLNKISPILMIIGMLGLYLEFKTPGFGIPGLIGLGAFALYFFGSYVAGLSGYGWALLFLLGLILVILEVFIFPGILILGLPGAVMILVSLVMAMVDRYPGGPPLPSLPQLSLPMRNIAIAVGGSLIGGWLIALWLPQSRFYQRLAPNSVSGERSIVELEARQKIHVGQVGEALSPLRPSGKAMFGDEILDVLSEGDMLAAGSKVRILRFSGATAIVAPAREP